MGVLVGVGVRVDGGVGVGVAGFEVGVGVGVLDEPLKTTLGLRLLASVTVKLLVVSWMVKVSVSAFCDVTLKVATPFCAWTLTGGAEPLTVRLESFEVWENVRLSDETLFLPQSCMLTVKVTVEPVAAATGDDGETSEYQKFGTPFAVVQFGFPLEFPELVLVNVTLGL